MATCGRAWPCSARVPTMKSCTHVFQNFLHPGHAQNRHPDGHHRAQEVTVLQCVVVHNAHHCDAWLVTRMVELEEKQRLP